MERWDILFGVKCMCVIVKYPSDTKYGNGYTDTPSMNVVQCPVTNTLHCLFIVLIYRIIRYITFDNTPETMDKSLAEFQAKIDALGGIDLCILGLGKNGHIGLNDPNESLDLEAHVVRDLSEQTLHHTMTEKSKGKITFGLTLGIRSIFEAKKILFLVSGTHKREIFAKFKEKKISSLNPASLLWLHKRVICLCDKEANGGNK